MGKSLSILAITTQVYNINGWSIWPPHLALGDDVELPISMEHLRPYLRKRKGPFIAPPGLRHNQRYYPKLPQSRQLLMESTDSNTANTVEALFQMIIHQIPKKMTIKSTSETTETFTTIFVQYLQQPSDAQMAELKKLYQSLRFEQEFVILLNNFIVKLRNANKDPAISIINTKAVFDILKKIISVEHPNNTNQSDKEKVMISLESASNDLIGDDANKLWVYSYWYHLLYRIAKDSNMEILPLSEQLSTNTTTFPESGIIKFMKQALIMNHPCQPQLKYYTDILAQMVNSNEYPYLKTAEGRFMHIDFLKKLVRECNFQSNDDRLKGQLVVTVREVMKDMTENIMPSTIMNYRLWQYVLEWGLIPDDGGILKDYGIIYGQGGLKECIEYIAIINEESDKFPFFETKFGFLAQMKYLIKVFGMFPDEVLSPSSQIYQRLDFVKVQYKTWQFEPEVSKYVNSINVADKQTIEMRNVLKLIISSNDQEQKGERLAVNGTKI